MIFPNARVPGYTDSNYYDSGGKYWVDGQVIKREDYSDHLNFREKMKDRLGLKTTMKREK